MIRVYPRKSAADSLLLRRRLNATVTSWKISRPAPREGGGERASPMSRALVVLCLMVQRGWFVQPDHLCEGLHLIKSRMYRNVESIVEGIAIRIVYLSCQLHDLLLLATFAEGLSARLQLRGATTVPDVI